MSTHSNDNTKRLFQAVDALNHQDRNDKRRRRRGHPGSSLVSSKRNAAAAQSQVDLYQSLVECRILLQRCRNNHNSDNEHEQVKQQEDTQQEEQVLCDKILGNLIRARDLLHHGHGGSGGDNDQDKQPSAMSSSACPRKLLKRLLGKKDDDDDDEADDNDHDEDEDGDDKVDAISDAISAQLQRAYSADRVGWKEVLDRRHKDERLHAGAVTSKQFRSLDASFFDQVEAAVGHEKTLLHHRHRQQHDPHNGRSSSTRTSVQGDREEKEEDEKEEEEEMDIGDVDDNRLYQQILKDFVGLASQSSSLSLSAANGGGLPMRSSCSSHKANVDRKASKGRKVRYTEIPKLVNFTFPLSRPETDLETNAWFRSLFGGAVTTAAASTKMTSSE